MAKRVTLMVTVEDDDPLFARAAEALGRTAAGLTLDGAECLMSFGDPDRPYDDE